MPKGKWFLEYTDDFHHISHRSRVGSERSIQEVKLSDTFEIDESVLIKKAQAEWDKVISQYPKGIKEAPLGGWRLEPCNPRIVLRIEAEFPEGPKMDPSFAKFLLL